MKFEFASENEGNRKIINKQETFNEHNQSDRNHYKNEKKMLNLVHFSHLRFHCVEWNEYFSRLRKLVLIINFSHQRI
jgi:hypothetical protein